MLKYFIFSSFILSLNNWHYFIIYTFIPLLCYKKFKNEMIPGIILSFLPIGFLSSIVLIQKIQVNSLKYMIFCYILAFSTFFLAFAAYIQNEILFIIYCSAFITLHGLCHVTLNGIIIGVLNNIYIHDLNIQKKVILGEMFILYITSVPITIITGLIFKYLGYFYVLLVFSIIYLFFFDCHKFIKN